MQTQDKEAAQISSPVGEEAARRAGQPLVSGDGEGAAPLQHLALIMDGSGRWAAQRSLARSVGHEAGAETARRVVRWARQREIPHLSLFAFSSLNWGRPSEEVSALMRLLERFLLEEEEQLIEEGIRLRAIGERSYLPAPLRALLERVEERSAGGNALQLTIAVSYDGRRDVVQAARRLVELARRGELLPADVTEPQLFSCLSTAQLPDVDLLIRTSGERRLSGFLPLETCYAELSFNDKLWPDLTTGDLEEELEAYLERQRRFGLTGAQLEQRGSLT